MADNVQKPDTVFQGVIDAINGGKRRTPEMAQTAQFTTTGQNNGGLIDNNTNAIEQIQQQYLDWQVNKIAHNLYQRTLYFDTDRISAYQDFRAMDMSPEIAAALNIIRDECLEANTIIPLLNGEKITIEELYNSNKKNFYVYSYNAEEKRFEPGLCQRVTYKGEKNVYKVTFDDDSFVMATSEHLWLSKGKNEYKKTNELQEGDSIEPFYTRISDENERIQGYEMLLENGNWEYTHRMVKRELWPDKKGVVHHKDIRKINNDPSNLEVMSWKAHQDLHHEINRLRWENNDEYAQKMRRIFSETNSLNGPYWLDVEWRNKRVTEMSKERKERFSTLSEEELREIFSRPGEENGMFGNGWKLTGATNGRFLEDKKREFNKEELIEAFKETNTIDEACELLGTNKRILYKSEAYKNLNIQRWEDLGFEIQEITIEAIEKACEKYLGFEIIEQIMGKICQENDWIPKKVNTFLSKNGHGKWAEFVAKFDSKNRILERIKLSVKGYGNISLAKACELNGFSYKKIEGIVERSEYKNYSNLKASINHKVKSIELVGTRKTYDLVNVGKYHNFAILTSNGTGVISHNCLTRDEHGNILEIYSENSRVKGVLKDLFSKRLNIEFNLKLWIRDLIKYGDYFVHLHIDGKEGIYNFQTLPVEEIHREEGYEGKPDAVRFRWETTNDYFEEWQVAHFRLIEDTKKIPYGRSILDPARKLWKQLQLAEDSMLVYRITRAPERRVFYIEIGNIVDEDIKQYIQKIQNQLKKQPIVDSKTGNINMKYNPMNITEDYFIPIRGDKSSRIDTLPGACLSLDTKIELLDGRSVSLSNIIEEFEKGNELWSYSINPKNGAIVPGRISWAGVTRKNTDVVKITLDNGETITCTPDHKFPTRFNGIKEAKDLTEGESMWAFNKKFEKIFKGKSKAKTYELVYDHNQNDWVYTHRIVAEYMREKGVLNEHVFNNENDVFDKKTIHHYDFNRYNNTPSNLFYMNSHDHVMLHQSMSSSYKEEKKVGIKEYWKNISKEELDKKRIVAKINFKKGSNKLQELLKDEVYKKEFYEKTSKTLKVVRGTKEARSKQTEIAKEQWKNSNFRASIIEKQTIKYSDFLLQFVVNRFKDGLNAEEILKDINSECSLFMNEFNNLNENNAQLKKMKNGFTHNNLSKMMMHFGYNNWRDFKNKVECFNHKIVSVEFLVDKQDTGTITIDGNEIYHDYHNFALSCGIFTKNSNLGDIQDIEYLQNKLFASLQVPKAYLNYADSLPGGSTLSQADLRFARTINGIQEIILMELRRIANIHLYFAGFKDDIDNFTLSLTNPSTQQELLKLETMKARLEVAKEYYSPDATSFASWTWVMENILGFSKADIKLILKQKKVEKKLFAEIDSAVDTYKKIGLFTDLDAKYEIPGAVAKPSEGGAGGPEGGGGGAGGPGEMGNMDIGSQIGGGGAPDTGGALDVGGGGGGGAPDIGGGGGTPEAGGEAAPLAESKQIKLGKLLKESDDRFENYLDDLLGKDEEINEEIDSALLQNNQKMNYKTQKLLERIQTDIDSSAKEPIEDNLIQEVKETSSLLSNSERMIGETKDMLSALESIFTPKVTIEESDDEIFEEAGDNGMNAHQDDASIERSQTAQSDDNNGMNAHQDDAQENRTHDKIIGAHNSLMTADQDETNRESSMTKQPDDNNGMNAHQDDAQKNNSMFNDLYGKS